MIHSLRGLMAGAAAGAAGTTALNAVTYLDMAWRARPASQTPEQAVEKLAERAGVDSVAAGGGPEPSAKDPGHMALVGEAALGCDVA